MREQTKYYNDLLPPENPAYPWQANGWQLLCYYCAQPICETQPEAAYRQRTIYMRGRWLHKDSLQQRCDPGLVRPDNEIDDPRCGCCATQTKEHGAFCSVGGKPQYSATPMSQKEDELRRVYGWHPNVKNTQEPASASALSQTVDCIETKDLKL